MFPDPKPDISACIIFPAEIFCIFDCCFIGSSQIGASSEKVWHRTGNCIEQFPGSSSSCKRIFSVLINRQTFVPACRQFALDSTFEFCSELWIFFFVRSKQLMPVFFSCCPAFYDLFFEI